MSQRPARMNEVYRDGKRSADCKTDIDRAYANSLKRKLNEEIKKM